MESPDNIAESKPAEVPPSDAKDSVARRQIGILMQQLDAFAKRALGMEANMRMMEKRLELLEAERYAPKQVSEPEES